MGKELVYKRRLPYGLYKNRFNKSLEINTYYIMGIKSRVKRIHVFNKLENYYSLYNDDLYIFKNIKKNQIN